MFIFFKNSKRIRIKYNSKQISKIIELYNFLKNKEGWTRSREIQLKKINGKDVPNIKISNVLLWQLAYQGFLQVLPKRRSFIFNGKKLWTQVFFWKPRLEKFEKVIKGIELSKLKEVPKPKIPIKDPVLGILNGENMFEESAEVENDDDL